MTVAGEDSLESPPPPPPYERFARTSIHTALPTASRDGVNNASNARVPPRYTESEVLLVQQVRVYQATRIEAVRGIAENTNCDATPEGQVEDFLNHLRRLPISTILLILWSAIATFLLVQSMQTDDDVFSWGRMQPGTCAKRAEKRLHALLGAARGRELLLAGILQLTMGPSLYGVNKGNWWSQYGFWQQNGSNYCTPEWNIAEPRECVSYATRRWSAELFNVHYDRNRACHETPITIPGGPSFESPAECIVSRKSVRGEWFVHDDEDVACMPRWIDLHAGHCKVYGVREYTAHLTHVTYSPWMACLDTPLEIHESRQGKPHDCRLTKRGAMEGVWHVGDEPYCRPHWGSVKSNGCVAGGYRRYHSRLWNIRSASWTDMCQTTPVVVAGQAFQGAMLCIDKGFLGMWGEWLIPDKRCSNFVASDSEPEEAVLTES